MQFAARRVLTIALVVAFSSVLDAQADVPLKPVDLKALNEHTFTPVLRDATGTDADSVQLTKGAHLYREGKIDEAASEFNIVIKRSPHNAEALFDMAVVKQAGKDLSTATDYYRRACEENPEKRKYAEALQEAQRQMHIAVLCNIAANAIKSGDLKNALSVYQQLDGVVHDAAIVKYDIGALYLRNNDPSSAKPYFWQATTLKPSDVDYKKALEDCIAALASSTVATSSPSSSASASPSSNSGSAAGGCGSAAVSLSSSTAKASDSTVSSGTAGTSTSPDTSGGSNNDYSLSNGLRAKSLSMDNVSFTDSASSMDKVNSENKTASAAPASSTNSAASSSANVASDSSTNGAPSSSTKAASSTNAASDSSMHTAAPISPSASSSTNAAPASSANTAQATSSSSATVATSAAGSISTPSSANGSSSMASSLSSTKNDKSSSGEDSSKAEHKPSDFHQFDPAETIGLNNSGVKALMKGDYETAIKNFKLALEKDPRYKLAENNLAIAYNNLGLQMRGTPDKALYQFHQAFFLDRTNRTTAQNIAGMIKIKHLDPNKAEDRDKLAKEELANNDAIGFHIESDAADWLRNNPGKVWTDGVVKPPQEPPSGTFGPYMAELQKRIKHNWYPPKGKETERVVVAFKISADGSMSNLHLKQTSNLVDVDQAALKAVENSKFAPLPDGAPASVDVQFTFDYNIFTGKNLLKPKDGDANQAKDSQSKDNKPNDGSSTKNGSSSQAKDASANSQAGTQPQGKGGIASQSKDAKSSQAKAGNHKKAKPKPTKSSVNSQ